MDIFWAKTPIDSEIPISWETIHSVYHHSIDVGFTAEFLIDSRFFSLQDILCRPYEEEDTGKKALCCLAALHDIGKITAIFQNKVQSLGQDLFSQGYPGPLMTNGHSSHGQDTAEFLDAFFGCLWPDCDPDIISAFAQIPAAHHGYYYAPGADDRIHDVWEQARMDHVKAICALWFPDEQIFPLPDNPEWITPQWTMLGAGLVSLADWIGSSLPFPVKAETDKAYRTIRMDQIRKTLIEVGLVHE